MAVEYILWRMGMMHTPSCLCFNTTLLGLVRNTREQQSKQNETLIFINSNHIFSESDVIYLDILCFILS